MQVAGWDAPDDAVIRIIGGKLGHRGAKCAAHLHARNDEVDPVLIPTLHALEMCSNVVFLTRTLLRAFHGDLVIAGVGLHPASIFRGTLSQDLWGDGILPMHIAEKMDNL